MMTRLSLVITRKKKYKKLKILIMHNSTKESYIIKDIILSDYYHGNWCINMKAAF